MFTKILIANRGEIARRVNRTAQAMGVQTVAVYSEADANALHVRECSEAVCLGPAAASESYLNIPKVIAAAKATGAQAIHPGYGFLSENAAFAQACEQAGLVFIGPSAKAIEIMGSKSEAKACVQAAGVPLIPGYFGADQSVGTLKQEAQTMGYPLMIKAVAGGGGKGIRTVNKAEEFESALQSCQREAQNAFGDAAVMLEKRIVNPRHIEVQIFADQHGKVLHLFERDCSAQRRHQKVIEEAPGFGLSDEQRKQIGQTAIDVARSVNYVGAGTVEFLMDASGDYYFMEMNTRLQVEHPVTEMITGFDLVRWQLEIAAGQPLSAEQSEIQFKGHAFEARVYAENPEQGFLPAIGKVNYWRQPEGAVEFVVPNLSAGKAVRMDGTIETGQTVTPYYDPMIGKLIVWGSDRKVALAQLVEALGKLRCVGLKTNANWLKTLCQTPAFERGAYDTGLIDNMNMGSAHAEIQSNVDVAAWCAVARWAQASALGGQSNTQGHWQDPWAMADGFSATSNPYRQDLWRLAAQDSESFAVHSHIRRTGDRLIARGELGQAGQGETFEREFNLLGVYPEADGVIRIELDDPEMGLVELIWQADSVSIYAANLQTTLIWQNPAHLRTDQGDAGHGVNAPMPGKIFAIMVKPGDKVSKGQPLIGLEAMKMEHTLVAPEDGVVKAIPHAVGEQVQEGVALIQFEE